MEPLGEAVINDMLITVARFREPWEAHMLRGRLEAEGIPAFILNEHQIGIDWRWSDLRGGARVQVSGVMAEDARAIEMLCRRGDFREELRAELGDLDDICCPSCGAGHYWKRRTVPQVLLSIFLIFFSVMTPPWTWICVCEKCGAKFKYGPVPSRHLGVAMTAAAIVVIPLALMAFAAIADNYYWTTHPLTTRIFKGLGFAAILALAIGVANFMRRRELSDESTDGSDAEL